MPAMVEELETIRAIKRKEEKTSVDWILIKQNKVLSIISEILVDVSKLHLSSDDAIVKIRECMQDNL